jgi:hypothetical protein
MSCSEQPVISANIERLQQFDEPVNGPLMRHHMGDVQPVGHLCLEMASCFGADVEAPNGGFRLKRIRQA